MTLSIVSNNGNGNSDRSPFDAIRGYRADGTEYWTARELMRFLGFTHWQTFTNTIFAAIADIELLEESTAIHHITKTEKLVKRAHGGGNSLVDYELSRLGCYHVALACKQRTLEVAAARRYFAVQAYKQELASEPKIPAILPEVRAVQIADSIRHITDTLSDNPRLAQLLIDLSISGIVEKSNLLAGSEAPALRGVAEIAAEMKLPITIKNRGDLGKFIVAAGFSPLQEKRLVNGAMRDVNCYIDSPDLRSAIASFFN